MSADHRNLAGPASAFLIPHNAHTLRGYRECSFWGATPYVGPIVLRFDTPKSPWQGDQLVRQSTPRLDEGDSERWIASPHFGSKRYRGSVSMLILVIVNIH